MLNGQGSRYVLQTRIFRACPQALRCYCLHNCTYRFRYASEI